MEMKVGEAINLSETKPIMTEEQFENLLAEKSENTAKYLKKAKVLIIRGLLTGCTDRRGLGGRREIIGGNYRGAKLPVEWRIFLVENEHLAKLLWKGTDGQFRRNWMSIRDDLAGPVEYSLHGTALAKKKGGATEITAEDNDPVTLGLDGREDKFKTGYEIEFDQDIDDDYEDFGVPQLRRRVYTKQKDSEVDSLYNRWKKGKLSIQPDFQRQFVWDNKKSSRLIESALLDIPLAAVYLAERGDGKELVIDGQQRLTAFFSFIDGRYPNGKDFKLTGLTVLSELNKKSFKDLDEKLQDKIKGYTIYTTVFNKESDEEIRFEIFERLNTGAVKLNDQELRNCIYRGPYNELLKDLSKDEDFRYLVGLKGQERRMQDAELVLKFAAFYHSSYLNYVQPMKKFLNSDMESYQNISENDADDLRRAFRNSLTIVKSMLDKKAFRRFYRGTDGSPNGKWARHLNASLYEVMMYSFAKADKNIIYRHLDSIREALIYLMTSDQEFIDSIEKWTSKPRYVTTRFDKWRLTLQNITALEEKEPRCFSQDIKQEMFDADPTCSICGQRIRNIDDAAVDHIEQYWLGGRTIPENARLTHRYCNWARPRKE